MKKSKLLLFFGILGFLGITSTNAYLLGLKSADNTIENIQRIEEKHKIRISLVGFIFDPRDDSVINTINQLSSTLGTTRIYHITISPNNFSAKEVAEGKFDRQYKEFFQAVKDNNLKVVFRTMHEMNGGRYPWSSHPENFKKARIHVRNISRELGISTENILFDFSVNHRDMPTKEIPNQKAKLIACQLSWKEKVGCYTFEDYYPGDEYVDIIGFSFYNRGKGFADRKRLTPNQIVYERGRNPLQRIKSFNKPIMIDEVATTAVWYEEEFDYNISKQIYKTNYKAKNTWLRQLQTLLRREQSIIGTVYFNVDYTKGLSNRLIGEADRSVIDLDTKKVYNTIFTLLKNSDDLHLRCPLLNLFGVGIMEINGENKFIPKKYITTIKRLQSIINKTSYTENEKNNIIKSLGAKEIKRIFPNLSINEGNEIIKILSL
ncbi:MAG: glycosyl hydrolase [Candidatus Absconditabacteria bacterium]|nr:glycosyl hydrolase [Candidatus Absconditabacteria bacterium]